MTTKPNRRFAPTSLQWSSKRRNPRWLGLSFYFILTMEYCPRFLLVFDYPVLRRSSTNGRDRQYPPSHLCEQGSFLQYLALVILSWYYQLLYFTGQKWYLKSSMQLSLIPSLFHSSFLTIQKEPVEGSDLWWNTYALDLIMVCHVHWSCRWTCLLLQIALNGGGCNDFSFWRNAASHVLSTLRFERVR